MAAATTSRNLIFNFFSLGTVQVIIYLVQLAVIPHVISRIGVDGFGIVAVAQVTMLFLATLTDYSFNQTATRDIALNRVNTGTLSLIFSRVFFARLCLCIIAFVILSCLLIIVPVFRSNMFLYLMAFTFVLGHATMINWFFQGIERMEFITWITLVARLFFAALVFLFIRGEHDGYLFLFFLGLGNLLAGAAGLVIVIRNYRLNIRWPGFRSIGYELKEGWHITLSHLANSSCHNANIFILRLFATDLIAGYYGIAERLFFAIRQVFVIFSQSVYPRFCQVLHDGKDQAVSFLRKIHRGFFILTVAGSVLLFVFSPWVIYFFTGANSSEGIFYLRIFCIIAIVVCLNIPGTLLLLATNQKREYLKLYLAAAGLNIVLNLVLARFYMAAGTVMAVLATELFITTVVIRMAARIGEDRQKMTMNIHRTIEY